MNKKSNTVYLILCSVVTALGGFLFGFDTAVISGTTDALTRVFQLSNGFWLGFTVAAALIGTILGAIIAGRPADRYGRHKSLYAVAIIYFISAIGSAWPFDWYSFLFFRFIGGVGVGASSVIAPMYIAEISPAHLRGRLVAIMQFNVIFGITMAYLSNYGIDLLAPGEDAWRWMFAVEAVPAALFFFLLFLTPESPRWLVAQNRISEAAALITRFGSESVDAEIAAIQGSLKTDRENQSVPFFHKSNRKVILLALAIAAFNQLSGINAVLYYAPSIFKMAGYDQNAAFLSSVIIGSVMTVFTMLALLVMDSLGRKKIMLVGTFGYLISLATIAFCFYYYGQNFDKTGGAVVLISLIVYIAAHAFGQGSVIWVFISEIFPNRLRARGQAFGSFVHWVGAATISWTFPVIANASGGHAFAFYFLMMLLQLVWVVWIMPETKNVSLEDLQKKLYGKSQEGGDKRHSA
ncbi:MAG: sugar porter family MFS transporter [Planctomycetia bacterium]|nr:sugar porter family MFS transporter [Planctomycetia bacterium]